MEFVITRTIKGKLHYMREKRGEDAYTDDIGCAVIFDDIDVVRDETWEGEEFWPILRDEEGCIVDIDRSYKH